MDLLCNSPNEGTSGKAGPVPKGASGTKGQGTTSPVTGATTETQQQKDTTETSTVPAKR